MPTRIIRAEGRPDCLLGLLFVGPLVCGPVLIGADPTLPKSPLVKAKKECDLLRCAR